MWFVLIVWIYLSLGFIITRLIRFSIHNGFIIIILVSTMAAELPKFVRKRTLLRKSITDLCEKAELLQDTAGRRNDVLALVSMLQEKLDKLTFVEEEIEDNTPLSVSTESISAEIAVHEALELRAKKIICASDRCSEVSVPAPGTSQTASSAQTEPHIRRTKLPNIELQSFNGNFLKFTQFWDSFMAIIDRDTSLAEIQKLQYLIRYLEGDAANVLQGLSITSDNYSHAKQLLQNRYGNTDKIISEYMQALWEIPGPSYTAASIITFHDTIEGYTRALASLGKPESSYGDLLIPLLLRKLPSDLRIQLTRERRDSDHWTLLSLKTAILREGQALEVGDRPLMYGIRSDDSSDGIRVTGAFLTGATNGRRNARPRKCAYCKNDDHRSVDCTIVVSKTKRHEIATRDNLCFNCLGQNHSAKICRSNATCQHCNQRHHTSLCTNNRKNFQSGSYPTPPPPPVDPSTRTTTMTLTGLANQHADTPSTIAGTEPNAPDHVASSSQHLSQSQGSAVRNDTE